MTLRNFFQLFDLAPKYIIDKHLLDQRLFEKQSLFHPDKHSNHSEAGQKEMLERSQEINLAYKTLKSDFLRAEYLLTLRDIDISKQELSPNFLMETFEWRERLENKDSLTSLRIEILSNIDKTMETLGFNFEKELYDNAKNDYIRLKFLKRFLEEIEKALNQ